MMRRSLLVIGTLVLFASCWAISRGAVTDYPTPALIFWGSAFVGYLMAAAGAGSRGVSAGASGDDSGHDLRRVVLLVLGVALALRLPFLSGDPVLSDDLWRYLWDGVVQGAGVNPFLHPPAAEALAPLRTTWHGLINNPTVPTIYPPVAQFAFRAVAMVGSSVLSLRILWLLFDLATIALLVRYAAHTGRDPLRVGVLYGWAPLLLVETTWSGHLEVVGLFGLGVCLTALGPRAGSGRPSDRRLLVGTVGLAWATLTKFAPMAALPVLLAHAVRRRGVGRGLLVLLSFCAAVALAYLPYLDAGPALFDGLRTYTRDWRANEGLFLLLERIFEGRWPPRVAAASIVAAVVGWASWRDWPIEKALFWVLGAGLLFSPTVHPWYLLWALPFAALRGSAGWILLCGLAPVGYWGLGAFHRTGSWPSAPGMPWLLWAIPLGLLLIEAAGRKPRPPHPHPTDSE